MMNRSVNTEQVTTFLFHCLEKHAKPASIEWLLLQKQKLAADPAAFIFFMAFSQTSRYFKKDLLTLSEEELKEANQLVSGFRPDQWDQLQTARSFLLLNYPAETATRWLLTVTQLFETADAHEQQSLYAALPIMPFPELMVARAEEGLRTNITTVFDAIALNNPYPGKYLETAAWNQMVIKGVFLERPLYKIQQLRERANSALADSLIDFAHERWSAGRKVLPELWRLVGPFLKEQNISLIEKLLQSEDKLEKQAALLACKESSLKKAADLLEQNPEVKQKIAQEVVNWDQIGKDYEKSKNV